MKNKQVPSDGDGEQVSEGKKGKKSDFFAYNLGIICRYEIIFNLMSEELENFPFFNRSWGRPYQKGYMNTLQRRYVPNFEWISLSTMLLGGNVLIFMVMHIMYRPIAYLALLAEPFQTMILTLNVEMVRNHPLYLYQAFTSIFIHSSYLHILSNITFGLLLMYEMEFSWRWSVPLGILLAFLANCLVVCTLEGMWIMGLSIVMDSYVGMIIGLVTTHHTIFRQMFYHRSFSFMLVFMMWVQNIASLGITQFLPHLYGFLLGVLAGAAFFPKHRLTDSNPKCDFIMKCISIAIWIIIVVLTIAI